MRPDRRATLAALGALALAACSRKDRAAHGPAPDGQPETNKSGPWRDLSFPPANGLPDSQLAALHIPAAAADLPLLIALHGRGESGSDLATGAHAWPKEYELERLDRRLLNPPLAPVDLLEMVTPERLAKINAALAGDPYRSMTIACPYSPHQAQASLEAAAPFGRFIVDQLIPRARAESGSKAPRAATGIDGVSMGGRLALLIGLSHPEVFGLVGALQPAVRADEAPLWSELARGPVKDKGVKLRLLTSEDDYFRDAVQAISAQLTRDGIPHELTIVPGNHGYEFNRGPGGAEMLLWHDRVSRNLPPI